MRKNYLLNILTTGMFLLLINSFIVGCGKSEDPKIENVRLYYWDVCSGDSGSWKKIYALPNNPQVTVPLSASPVLIRAEITDNTAVVNPTLTITGARTGLKEAVTESVAGQRDDDVECSGVASESKFNCQWTCMKDPSSPDDPPPFQCALEAAKYLLRGDQLTLSVPTISGTTLQWNILVSEASDADGCTGCRVLKVSSVGDYSTYDFADNFLTVEGTTTEGGLLQRSIPLGRSSDVMAVDKENGIIIKILDSGQVDSDNLPTITWKSLEKWNSRDEKYERMLILDAKTGYFEKEFYLLDPRARDTGGVLTTTEGVSTYRVTIEASDIADQKKDSGRVTTNSYYFNFDPVDPVCSGNEAPSIEDLNIDDIDPVETATARQTISAKVSSWTGEIKSLQINLSNKDEVTDPEYKEVDFFVNPESFSLYAGTFETSIELVSDWDGDGVIDSEEVSNYLKITAIDIKGEESVVSSEFVFQPPVTTDALPQITIAESFPVLPVEDFPFTSLGGEEKIRVRVKATDNTGQPTFSKSQYFCSQDTDATNPPYAWEINVPRCPEDECTPEVPPEIELDSLPLNATGEYPENSWQWDEMPFVCDEGDGGLDDGEEIVIVYRATEKKENVGENPACNSLEVHISPDEEAGAGTYTASSLTETGGPNVTLTIMKQGVVQAENFFILNSDETLSIAEITIYKNISPLNEIVVFPEDKSVDDTSVAYPDGYPEGYPELGDELSTPFTWAWDNINALLLEGEDRLCLGARSVSGHATLVLLEFVEVSAGSGTFLVGVTRTDEFDLGLCGGV